MVYISLYRKYRSQNFEEIVGQTHITTTLKNAISTNRIAHAYLFSGPRGTGKTSTARIFAKALNCEKGPTPEPCNECEICDSITRDVLFDVVEIDAASNRGIDDIRDIKEKVRVPPIQARYKVYIIDEVHMLSTPAFNALLKTLEEPPPNVIFILATTEAQRLLATILSRCQRFDFRRIPTHSIHDHLLKIAEKEKFKVDPDALNTIAATADGSLRDAISILDQLVSYSGGKVSSEHVSEVLGMIPGGELLSFIDALLESDAPRCFELFDQFFQEGKSVSLFVRLLLEHFRNVYFVHAGMPVDTADLSLKAPLEAQAKKIPNPLLVKLLDETAKVEERIRWENYPRIILEILIIKLLHVLHSSDAEARPPSSAPRGRPAAAPPAKKSPAPSEPPPEPAAEHAPAPLPSLKGELTFGKIQAHWESFLDELKKESLPTCIIASSGTPAAFENNTLTIGFDRRHQFHKEQSQERANSERIEKILNSYFGTKINFKARTVETVKPAEDVQPEQQTPTQNATPETQPTSIIDLVQTHFPESRQI